MVTPDHEPKEANGDHRIDHRAVAEHRFTAIDAQNIAHHPHRRKNQDVHLRVAKEPEKVLPKERLPPFRRVKEVRAIV